MFDFKLINYNNFDFKLYTKDISKSNFSYINIPLEFIADSNVYECQEVTDSIVPNLNQSIKNFLNCPI